MKLITFVRMPAITYQRRKLQTHTHVVSLCGCYFCMHPSWYTQSTDYGIRSLAWWQYVCVLNLVSVVNQQ